MKDTTDLGYPPDLERAIQDELAGLASIEARYSDELARLEHSVAPGSAREHLREQLQARRTSARQPHVLRLADLHQRTLEGTMFKGQTMH